MAALVRNVINTGIRPQARTDDEALNAQIEAAFDEWCRPENCDVTGQMGFYEMQRMLLRRKIVDGEILVKKVIDKQADIPLLLQPIRVDLLDTALMVSQNGRHVIRSGIELSDALRPLAYYIEKKTPDGYVVLDSERVPASQIIHLWTKNYPDQIRGISDLATSIKRIKDLDEYLDAETVAAKIAACFSLFVTRQNAIGSGAALANAKLGTVRDKDGKPIARVRPGMIAYMAPGDDIKAANPGRSATTAKDFANLHERMIGSGLGLSYEMISRDFNTSSYSAARQGNLEDRRTFQPMQQWMVEKFCDPVYRAFLDAAVLSGALKLPNYWQQKQKYSKVEWVTPGWASIDPLKEAQADVLNLSNGGMTLAQQCAEHGTDWRDQLAQMAKEKDYAEELGLRLSIHTPEAVQAAATNHPEQEEKEDGTEE